MCEEDVDVPLAFRRRMGAGRGEVEADQVSYSISRFVFVLWSVNVAWILRGLRSFGVKAAFSLPLLRSGKEDEEVWVGEEGDVGMGDAFGTSNSISEGRWPVREGPKRDL